LAQKTRGRVKVALSGDGGDELFGGYDRYRAMWLGESFRRMPRALRAIAVNKLWQRIPGTHPKSRAARAKRLLGSLDVPPAQRYAAYMRLFDEPVIHSLLRGGERDGAGDVASAQWLTGIFQALSGGRDPVRTAMAVDRITYLPEDLLTKVDRSSMLHALEVRSPFMDAELVRFAAGLGTSDLFGKPTGAAAFMNSALRSRSRGKRILREAFAAELPGFVFQRRKMGFAVPVGEWLRGELRPLLRESLAAADSFATQHLMTGTIDKMIADHESRRADHSQRLYALLMLELWWRSTKVP
jgi:asparagine synthase (glutamine-hydrolysing)